MNNYQALWSLRQRLVCLLAVALSFSVQHAVADWDDDSDDGPPTYEFIVIAESLPFPIASDINDKRQVVGWFGDFPFSSAWTWQDGVLDTFNAPGADATYGNGLNNRGIIAGHAITGILDPPEANRGFLKAGSVFVTVQFEDIDSYAFDVNNRGKVVGVYCAGGPVPGCFNDGEERLGAWLMDKRGARAIDPPGAVLALGFGINDRGDTVGVYSPDFFSFFGFLRSKHGEYTTIEPPGSFYTEARGVNNRGDIVGGYDDAAGTHGFLRKKTGEIFTVDFPGEPFSFLTGINNRGDVTGVVFDSVFFVPKFGFVALRQDDDDSDSD